MSNYPTVEYGAGALYDPNLPPAELAVIATWYPQLWPWIVNHPNAYPQLLDWLAAVGDESVRRAVAARRAITEAPQRLRQAMTRLTGVFVGGIAIMQIVGPIVMVLAVMLDPAFINGALTGDILESPDQLTNSLGGWMILLAAGGGALYLVLRGRRLVTTDITTTIPVGDRWNLLGLAIIATLAAQGVGHLLSLLLGDYGQAPDPSEVGLLTGSIGMVAYVCLFGPIIEEVVFRGAILRHLAPFGANFAIVTQALLFSLYHMNWNQGVFTFFLGLVFGYVALRFSLKWSVALHVLNNVLATLGAVTSLSRWVLSGVTWAALIAVLVLLWVKAPARKQLVAEGRSPLITRPFATGWKNGFFLTVVIILFAVSGMVSGMALLSAM
ncbi:MAG: CPBP family intramembrane metalloprotease [Propionibacteriaceae bacterium]|jgi:membrane protease YdiL (CAAX protease family)|nr:CPBP family intramembrane metalloprotease [Propionibacteriaceae bacterium]